MPRHPPPTNRHGVNGRRLAFTASPEGPRRRDTAPAPAGWSTTLPAVRKTPYTEACVHTPPPGAAAVTKETRSPEHHHTASFRDFVADVRPLHNDRVHHERRKPAAHPRQRQRDEARVLRESLTHPYDPSEFQDGDSQSFAQPGVQKSVIRKLHRGQFRVEAELDLHGLNRAAARFALQEFLQRVLRRNARCVRIIHGKGKRSSNRGPVIKPLVAGWLRRRSEVLAFCTARQVDGGSGALYVLLRAR